MANISTLRQRTAGLADAAFMATACMLAVPTIAAAVAAVTPPLAAAVLVQAGATAAFHVWRLAARSAAHILPGMAAAGVMAVVAPVVMVTTAVLMPPLAAAAVVRTLSCNGSKDLISPSLENGSPHAAAVADGPGSTCSSGCCPDASCCTTGSAADSLPASHDQATATTTATCTSVSTPTAAATAAAEARASAALPALPQPCEATREPEAAPPAPCQELAPPACPLSPSPAPAPALGPKLPQGMSHQALHTMLLQWQRFEPVRVLGKGGFARSVEERLMALDDGMEPLQVALKFVHPRRGDGKAADAVAADVLREEQALFALGPSGVFVGCFGSVPACAVIKGAEACFDVLFMECGEVTLQALLDCMWGGHTKEDAAMVMPHTSLRWYFAWLVGALGRMHNHPTFPAAMRDVKLDNIVVMADGSLRFVDAGTVSRGTQHSGCVGTLLYMAPEVRVLMHMEGDAHAHTYGSSVDVWSAGVVLLELAGCQNATRAATNAWRGRANALPGWLDPELSGLLSECVFVSGDRRWGAAQLQGHPYFQGVDWASVAAGPCPHAGLVMEAREL